MGSPAQIDIKFNKIEGRKQATIKDKQGNAYKVPIFKDEEDVRGKVTISLNKAKKLDHQGIRVELVA